MNTNSKLCKKSRSLPLLVAMAAIAALAITVQASGQHIITYEVPGAGTGAWQGIQAPGINPAGAITGFYSDSKNVYHGFLRTPDGKITAFDAPGAGNKNVTGFYPTAAGVLGGQGTYGISINLAGAITGAYIDKDNVMHGFLRFPDGKFTTIDDPNAGTGYAQGTEAGNINSEGVIAGSYADASSIWHGFVRTPDGRFTTFDAMGEGNSSGQGTFVYWASCINTEGTITGGYVDEGGVNHGYVRAPDGTIREFNVRGAGISSGQGTWSWSINSAGEVTAEYVDADYVAHGYVRAPDGRLTKFDVWGAGTGAGQGTIGEGINTEGVIEGNYINTSGVNRGFVRAPDGRLTKFDVPGAGSGAGQGTIPLTINPAGAITGAYIDKDNVIHGFLWLPD